MITACVLVLVMLFLIIIYIVQCTLSLTSTDTFSVSMVPQTSRRHFGKDVHITKEYLQLLEGDANEKQGKQIGYQMEEPESDDEYEDVASNNIFTMPDDPYIKSERKYPDINLILMKHGRNRATKRIQRMLRKGFTIEDMIYKDGRLELCALFIIYNGCTTVSGNVLTKDMLQSWLFDVDTELRRISFGKITMPIEKSRIVFLHDLFEIYNIDMQELENYCQEIKTICSGEDEWMLGWRLSHKAQSLLGYAIETGRSPQTKNNPIDITKFNMFTFIIPNCPNSSTSGVGTLSGLGDRFPFLYICPVENTNKGWFINLWIHEFGHVKGLDHSGSFSFGDGAATDDTTCIMGYHTKVYDNMFCPPKGEMLRIYWPVATIVRSTIGVGFDQDVTLPFRSHSPAHYIKLVDDYIVPFKKYYIAVTNSHSDIELFETTQPFGGGTERVRLILHSTEFKDESFDISKYDVSIVNPSYNVRSVFYPNYPTADDAYEGLDGSIGLGGFNVNFSVKRLDKVMKTCVINIKREN